MERNNKKIIRIFSLIVVIVFILWILLPHIKESKVQAEYEANIQTLRESPAAEFCQKNWWTLEIKTDEMDGIYWMCNFEDWSACEILEYLRWNCLSLSEQNEIEDSYCADSSVCGDEEPEDLSSRIQNINSIENIDWEIFDDEEELDIDLLYDYFEKEFSYTWSEKEQVVWDLDMSDDLEY